VQVDYWGEVGKSVRDRMADRSLTQQELAVLSGVSTATLRKIQAGNSQQRTRAVLASVSRALGFEDDRLWRISRGEAPDGEPPGGVEDLRAVVTSLALRVEALESQLGAIQQAGAEPG
jgi:transcriptional regulator with XRE-family HTH domain